MIYCFWLVIATGAFWVVNMWHVAELFDGLVQTGRWPVGIYPGWLRFGVTFLVPVAFAVTVPGRGCHLAARVADAGGRDRLRGGSLRGYALVLALRPQAYTGASA